MKIRTLFVLLLLSMSGIAQLEITSFESTMARKSEDSLKINPATLNILFADQLSGIVFKSEDLTLQRYYATLSNEDNQFSFGINVTNLKKKTDKLNWLLTLGVNSKSTSSFATVFKNGKVQNEINGTVKISYLGRGIITRNKTQRTATYNYYKKYLLPKYSEKDEKYSTDGGLDDDASKLIGKGDYKESSHTELIEKKRSQLKKELLEEEMKAIIENKWFNRIWDHWVSFEASVPMSMKQYKVSDSLSNASYTEVEQYPWNFSMQYTSMWKWQNNSAIYLSGKARLNNDNNIERESISSADFLSFINQSATNQAVTESNKVYVGRFKQFASATLGGEVILFPWNQYIGLSASIEQVISNPDAINWKLGIPITLKDKDAKPTVNFEIQWKEINKNHLVGVRVGFVLGKYVN